MESHLDATRITGPDVCRQILLCGKDNPLSAHPGYALYHEPQNCSGHRLQSRILGLPARSWYLPIWRTNLCVGGWDRDLAIGRAERLIQGDPGAPPPWRLIVVLGDDVLGAFCRAGRSDFCSFEPTGVRPHVTSGHEMTILPLPHPSGRNAFWNHSPNIQRARAILSRLIPGIPWGDLDGEMDTKS